MNKKVAIAGYSGHAYVVIDSLLVNNFNVVGYIDVAEAKQNPFKLPFLGTEQSVDTLSLLKGKDIAVALGVGDNHTRNKIAQIFQDAGIEIITVVHPAAIISKHCRIEKGCFIAAGAIVQAFAKIEEGCIINSGAIIEHECAIEKFCHIAPGATLAGNVTIGENTFFGAGAVAKQGTTVGKNSIIGAGAVVTRNVPSNQTWAGVPAKKIK